MRRRFVVPAYTTLVLAVLAGLGVPEPARAGDDVWTTHSLAGYTGQVVALDPQMPHHVYLGTQRGILYSPAGGDTWQDLVAPFQSVIALAVDPHQSGSLYACADGALWKSGDGGGSWEAVSNAPMSNPWSLLLPPASPGTLYVLAQDTALRSSDGGLSWAGLGLPVSGRVTAVAVDPGDPARVFAVVERQGLFVSRDGATSWAATGSGWHVEWAVSRLYFDAGDRQVLYAGQDGMIRSADGGASWTLVEGEPYPMLRAADPHTPGRVYAAAYRGGLVRSDDAGLTWVQIGTQMEEYARVDAVVADPQVAGVLYALSSGGVFKSPDAGWSWARADTGERLGMLLPDLDEPARVFSESGLFLTSEDAGDTWQTHGSGLPEGCQVWSAAQGPAGSGALYAATECGLFRGSTLGGGWSATGLPPSTQASTVAVDPADSSHLLAGGPQGLLESRNAGESWAAVDLHSAEPVSEPGTVVPTAAPAFGATGAVLTVDFHAELPGAVYVGTDRGLYTSRDGGSRWQVPAGLSGQPIRSLLTTPGKTGSVLVGTDYGVFRSDDQGRTWRSLGLSGVRDLAVDPSEPRTVYAGTAAGVVVSLDGDEKWQSLASGLPRASVLHLAALRTQPTTLLAVLATEGGSNGSLWTYVVRTPPRPTASPAPTRRPTRTPRPDARPTREVDRGDKGGGDFPWLPVIAGGSGLVILAAGGTTAVAVRRRRKRPERCPACGAPLPAEGRFCMKCGKRRPT